jgi:hypothetical protein
LSLDFITFKLEYGNGIFNRLLCSGTLNALDDDFTGFLIGFLPCVFDDFLLQGKCPGLRFLLQTFNKLCFGFLSTESSYFFQFPDVFFLVFFQFSPFLVNNLNLSV